MKSTKSSATKHKF